MASPSPPLHSDGSDGEEIRHAVETVVADASSIHSSITQVIDQLELEKKVLWKTPFGEYLWRKLGPFSYTERGQSAFSMSLDKGNDFLREWIEADVCAHVGVIPPGDSKDSFMLHDAATQSRRKMVSLKPYLSVEKSPILQGFLQQGFTVHLHVLGAGSHRGEDIYASVQDDHKLQFRISANNVHSASSRRHIESFLFNRFWLEHDFVSRDDAMKYSDWEPTLDGARIAAFNDESDNVGDHDEASQSKKRKIDSQ